MPSLDCGFSDAGLLELYGPSVVVNIGFDPKFTEIDQGRPEIENSQYKALIDTGASASGIDSQLASALQLPVIGQTEMAGVGGVSTTNAYLAHVHLPGVGWNFIGRFVGVAFAGTGESHHAVIGRDFLRFFRLSYDGRTGRAELTDSQP